MIRSLAIYPETVTDDIVVRRNLERDHLEQAIIEDGLLWIDVVDAESEEIAWLSGQFMLNPAVVEDLQRNDRRPTLLVYPDYLFLSLFEPHIKLNRVEGREIHCLVTDSCFITVRGSGALSIDDAYTRAAQSPDAWQSNIAYCFYLTAQYVTDTYYPLLDRISNQLNDLENELLNGGADGRPRSQTRIPHEAAVDKPSADGFPQREVFSKVIGEKRLTESGDIRDLFRHLYARLLRVYNVIDSQRDLSSNVLDLMQNQQARR